MPLDWTPDGPYFFGVGYIQSYSKWYASVPHKLWHASYFKKHLKPAAEAAEDLNPFERINVVGRRNW